MNGLTPAGFIPKSLATIQEEIAEAGRAEFQGLFDLSGSTRIGRFTGALAEREALIWELLGAIVAARDPAAAEGVALDDVCALTGTIREGARRSRVAITVTGVEGTNIPALSVVSVGGGGPRFQVETAIGIGVGGTGSGWAVAVDVGPVPAVANTLTVIENSVSGWQTVTNPLDAELGALRESDPALRLRREDELQAPGGSGIGAIRADVLKVAGVMSCAVFENTTDITNPEGMSPHSIEVVVQGGADLAIAQRIWASKPAGIATHGAIAVEVEDAEGGTQVVRFSRPGLLLAWVRIVIQRGAAWPASSEGSDLAVLQVKQSVAEFDGANLGMGDTLVWEQLFQPAYAALPARSIYKIPTLQIGLVPGSLGTSDIPATSRQLVVIDTSRITVELTP